MSNETATLVKLSAAEQAAAVKKGDVTSRELVEAHLKVIEAAEPSIKAFLKVSGDVALEQADAFDAKSAEDPRPWRSAGSRARCWSAVAGPWRSGRP